MDYFVRSLQQNPELAIFLTLAVGFLIGRVKFGSFSLGIVVGTLLAGVLIGQLDIKVPAIVKTVFFDLFLFTTGYKVGPQFFRGLKRDAFPQVLLTVVLCVTCLLTAIAAAWLFGYDMGTAAGLLAGAFSESTVIGTAGEAIQRLALPAEEKTALVNNIPVAYAVTYLIGTASLVWFLPTIGPKLMGIKLREEAERMQSSGAGAAELGLGIVSAAKFFDARAYRVTNPVFREQDDRAIGGAPRGQPGFHRAHPSRGRNHRVHAGHGHSPGRRGCDPRPARDAREGREQGRARSGRQGPARHSDRNRGRGRHAAVPGRENVDGLGKAREHARGCFSAASCGRGRRCPSSPDP